jgi:hypothetical protein
MMNDSEVKLVPKDWDQRHKPFRVEARDWRHALQLVSQPNFVFDKRTVPDFLKKLRLALVEANTESRERLAGLVAFLEGAGKLGFTMSRGYRRAI